MEQVAEGLNLLEPKLLMLFDLIYRTGSVTRAGEQLGQSQPTVSIWLSKLRIALQDPLFVRTPSAMLPTPRSVELIEPVREALDCLRRISSGPVSFNPTLSSRRFRLCMSDGRDVTMLKPLLNHLNAVAPHVTVEVTRMDGAIQDALAGGEVDLAFGFIAEINAAIYQQVLCRDDWVCLCSTNHPRRSQIHTLQGYAGEPQVLVANDTTDMLRTAIARSGVQPTVVLELPGYLSLPRILEDSSLIATVPRVIGEELARTASISLFESPVAAPPVEVKQYWHARYQHDPANSWLRATCASLFAVNRSSGDRGRDHRHPGIRKLRLVGND